MNCATSYNAPRNVFVNSLDMRIVLLPDGQSPLDGRFSFIGKVSYEEVMLAINTTESRKYPDSPLRNLDMVSLFDIQRCWEQSYILLAFAKCNQLSLLNIDNLLEAGAYINFQDDKEMTPLMYAAQHGNVEIVNYLLKKDANVKLVSSGKKAWDLATDDCRAIIARNGKDGGNGKCTHQRNQKAHPWFQT